MWISCAKYILTTKTLCEALPLSGYHSGEGGITDEEIISSCAGFLEIDQCSTPRPYRAMVRRDGEDITITRPPLSNIFAEKWRTWICGSNEAFEEVFFTDPNIRFAHRSAYTYLAQRQKILFPQSSSTISTACLLALSPNEVLCALPLISTFLLEYGGIYACAPATLLTERAGRRHKSIFSFSSMGSAWKIRLEKPAHGMVWVFRH